MSPFGKLPAYPLDLPALLQRPMPGRQIGPASLLDYKAGPLSFKQTTGQLFVNLGN
jgi:hypothetical protein